VVRVSAGGHSLALKQKSAGYSPAHLHTSNFRTLILSIQKVCTTLRDAAGAAVLVKDNEAAERCGQTFSSAL
jgi:hypothetical protein